MPQVTLSLMIEDKFYSIEVAKIGKHWEPMKISGAGVGEEYELYDLDKFSRRKIWSCIYDFESTQPK